MFEEPDGTCVESLTDDGNPCSENQTMLSSPAVLYRPHGLRVSHHQNLLHARFERAPQRRRASFQVRSAHVVAACKGESFSDIFRKISRFNWLQPFRSEAAEERMWRETSPRWEEPTVPALTGTDGMNILGLATRRNGMNACRTR